MLRRVQKMACSCDTKEQSCNTYEDALGKNRFWCYVRESRRGFCEEQGVQLYWDAKVEKIWSAELCEEKGCACSNIGMHPMNLKDPGINHTELNANKFNYGSSCKEWGSYKRQWCYVGWDSTCPDRQKATEFWISQEHPGWQPVRHQFFSSLPCSVDRQIKARAMAQEACYDSSFIMEVIWLIHLLLFVPMAVIIFKFLANRCGDEFQCEEQFAVVLSTDDDESEDEWQAGQARSSTDLKESSDRDEPRSTEKH